MSVKLAEVSVKPEEAWRWYIVVDDTGDASEVFNSLAGAKAWAIEWGGKVIQVKSSIISSTRSK